MSPQEILLTILVVYEAVLMVRAIDSPDPDSAVVHLIPLVLGSVALLSPYIWL